MEKHIWINPSRIKRDQKKVYVDGVELLVSVSPYDVPKAIVGRYEKGTGQFLIVFEYIDSEPATPKPAIFEGVQIQEGRHSGKILSISIPVNSPPHDQVGLISLQTKVRGALHARREQLPKKSAMNQEVAEDILQEDNLKELIGADG